VGIAQMSGEEMVHEKKGKAIEIVHYVGDRLWSFLAKSL
jgi:predicted RNA-binding protein (TIGR00451 family)